MRLLLTKITVLFVWVNSPAEPKKATVVKPGIPNLIKYNEQWGDISLQAYLETQSKKNLPRKVLVHASCRREYTDPKRTKPPLSQCFGYLFVCLLHS